MTSFFVRHAQPDMSWRDDRTRPLTKLGFRDTKEVSLVVSKQYFTKILRSRHLTFIPFCAGAAGMEIQMIK